MNLKTAIPSIIIIAIIAVATVWAGNLIVEYVFPSKGTITEAKATIYFDDAPYANGTEFDWGPMMRGSTYYATLKVENTGTVAFNVTLEITAIPVGISYVWLANETIVAPGASATADLEITISATFPLGVDQNLGTYYVRLYEAS
jgi:hypothetical protein